MIVRTVLLVLAVAMPVLPVLPIPSVSGGAACSPTLPDALGPFYKPGAPVRAQVGKGHVLTGTVRSARDCRTLGGARIEFWLAGPAGEYGDAWRATVAADEGGRFRFESHVPPPYSGRPSHIHVRVSATGHRVLVTQYYPAPGTSEGRFDLVLLPQ